MTNSSCVDKALPGRVSDCPALKQYCNVDSYKPVMARECRKTCNLCGQRNNNNISTNKTRNFGSSTCVDFAQPGQVSECPSRKALCQKERYKEFMKKNCQKSCGYCA
ncbi:unnamed protein product [Dracunculus medinensis]|uniref:ShTK domain protein n=1 Tax=Dracunculus medinensis TaxID=318479 RepID=A0A0N4U6J6_DRAME|nr:unnamed protein product [Dracunculus medinensis]